MKHATMTMWMLTCLLAAMAGSAGCGSEDDGSATENARAAEEATDDEPAPPPAPPKEAPLGPSDVPVAEDFDQEAVMRVNPTNYRAELDSLAKEITQDQN